MSPSKIEAFGIRMTSLSRFNIITVKDTSLMRYYVNKKSFINMAYYNPHENIGLSFDGLYLAVNDVFLTV